MAQADSITTAIRQLMSRGRPPKSTNPERAAHIQFVSALAENAPRPLHPETNSEDLEGRADHLEKLFAALLNAALGPAVPPTFCGSALKILARS